MNKAVDENRRPGEGRRVVPALAGGPAPRPGGSAFRIYKPGQGAYVRWGSAVAAGIVLVGFAAFFREELTRVQNEWVEYLIPAALVVGAGYAVFRALGQSHGVVDFMIATEGEMKKVSWSSRREVLGATKVVIATVMALAAILLGVNILFMAIFESIGVLRIGMLAQLLGGRPE